MNLRNSLDLKQFCFYCPYPKVLACSNVLFRILFVKFPSLTFHWNCAAEESAVWGVMCHAAVSPPSRAFDGVGRDRGLVSPWYRPSHFTLQWPRGVVSILLSRGKSLRQKRECVQSHMGRLMRARQSLHPLSPSPGWQQPRLPAPISSLAVAAALGISGRASSHPRLPETEGFPGHGTVSAKAGKVDQEEMVTPFPVADTSVSSEHQVYQRPTGVI